MKNNKSIYIVGIFMLVTMVSIGYAILTGQLNINGTSKVKAASWDIYFANIKIKEGSVTASVKPSITNKTTVNFEVDLNKPGDFYEFNVDVVNDGDLDAMIESISITPELTTDQQKYLSYSVTYLDDVPLEVKDILHAKKVRTLKVKVEYLKSVDNGELNQNDETLNIKATIKYVQADNTAKESSSNELEPKLINVLSGNGTNVGDELAIGDEHFYVIKNDGENITMLSKYNLLVGNSCIGKTSSSCTQLTNSTGIQDESAIGIHYVSGTSTPEYPTIGTLSFAPTNYWGNGNLLKSKYGTSYPSYVYDENSNLYQYIDSYKTYLENFGVEIKEARLISYNELVTLGCNPSSKTCTTAPSWVWSVGYWSGSAETSYLVWRVGHNGVMSTNSYTDDFFNDVRPVIEISADAI